MRSLTIFNRLAMQPMVLLFIAASFLFLIGPHADEFVRFQTRFAIFAREMLVHGISIFPTVYNEPYPDYPATSTIFIVLLAKLWGELNPFIAVIPSALAAAATVALTYALGALYSKKWGFYSAFLLLLTAMFFTQGRTISLDAYTTFVTTACFYLALSSDKLNDSKRIQWIFPVLLFGFACRGPIGLVAPTGVVCSYYLATQNWRRFWTVGLIASLLLACACAVLFFAAYKTGGMPFVQDVLRMEIMGRLTDNSAQDSYAYYFTSGFGNYAITFPLAALVLLRYSKQLFAANASAEIKFLRYLMIWTLIVLLGFSIPACKRYYYVLSISPAISVIAAYFLIDTNLPLVLQKLRQGVLLLLKFLPILLSLGLVIVYLKHMAVLPKAYYQEAILGLLVLQSLSFIYHKFIKSNESISFVLAIAVLAFAAVNLLIIEPVNLAVNRTRGFVLEVEQKRLQEQADLVFYRIGKDSLDIKYAVNVPVDTPQPAFLGSPEEITAYPRKAIFMTRAEFIKGLPAQLQNQIHIIQTGMLGHNKVVAFEKV